MEAGLGNLWLISAVAAVLIAVLAGLLLWLRAAGGIVGRRNGRLGITDFCVVDKNRRLVIVRRDNVEHLLLIGGTHDLVVEVGIGLEPAVNTRLGTRSFRDEMEEVARPAPVPVSQTRPKSGLRSAPRAEPRLPDAREKPEVPGDENGGPLEPPLR